MSAAVHQQDGAHHGRAHAAVEALKHKTGLSHDAAYAQDRAVDPQATRQPVSDTADGIGAGPQVVSTSDNIEVLCGPLINYKRMSNAGTDRPQWHGSILIVTKPGNRPGQLTVRSVSGASASGERSFDGERLFEDPKKG